MGPTYRMSKGGAPEIRAYLKRADELWHHAVEALRRQEYDACSIMVIHASISLADAACLVRTGSRYAGISHDEAVQFFTDLKIDDAEFKQAARRLQQMVGEKSAAEYGGRNLSEKESELIFKNGERFRTYLFKTILKDYYRP